MSARFWLSDRAWAAIEPLLPTNQPGARRLDDRRVISGIIHVLRIRCRWEAWRRRLVGLVLQRDNLHLHLDAAENIALTLRIQGWKPGDIAARVDQLRGQISLAGQGRLRTSHLSGGEAQRVAIAVALAAGPKGAVGRRTDRRVGQGHRSRHSGFVCRPATTRSDGFVDGVPQPAIDRTG